MKSTIKTLASLSLVALLTIVPSCKKKGCMDATALNFDEDAKKDDGSCEFYTVEVPTTYTFKDANGNNTVSINGQQQRLAMLDEMGSYIKTGNTAGVTVSASILKAMYANSSYSWKDSDGLGMTGSSKQLKNKTAMGDAGVQAMFESYMDSLEALSSSTVTGVEDGSSSKGGVWANDGSKGPYLMSSRGWEYRQIILKGLMCAVFMNQMTAHYLDGLNGDDNSKAVDEGAGEYYTEMEHHWDEAYGYFTGSLDFPTSGTDKFWGEYTYSRESSLGSATKIATAFRTGRAAIANKDYETRDKQVTIIRDEMEKACAAAGIHYLNEVKSNLSFATARNHMLSEAWGFINGLRYGYNSTQGISISSSDVDLALSYIGEDFNSVTVQGLQKAIDLVAEKTGLTAYKSSL